MKSKVFSYDIRDSSNYFGVLELEKLLKNWKNSERISYKEVN